MTRAVLRKDLVAIWTTPLPYVVGALFHLVLGLLYIDQLETRAQAVSQPLFPLAAFLLVVSVPLLTMRSIAEEARSGTLDLLQVAPLAARAIVVGKWLAAWITAVVVLAPATVLVALLELFGEPDPGPVTAGFTGLVLLAGALSGLGVLASSLTTSQPVAAVAGFFVSLLLWFAHAGSESLSVGTVLSRLSLSEHLRAFAGGGIDTADAGYFLLLAAACLTAAVVAVDARRLR